MTISPEETVIRESLSPTGFMTRLRENHVDTEAFAQLLTAVRAIASEVGSSRTINRVVVACLFEAPWEIENTVPHYSQQDAGMGRQVSSMANELREAINDMLWRGLEEVYEQY